MKKMKLNIQLFNGSVAIQTITETTDIYTNQSTFTIPAKMTTTGSTYNNSNAYMTLQWKYASDSSWTSLNKQTFGIGKSSSKTKSWTLTLTHNNDGTLEDINFRVKWYITDSTNGTTGVTTYTPTTIPRGSEFDTLNWNRDTQILLNSTISIPAIQHISPAYHKLEARFMINGNEQVVASWTGVSITNGYISFSFNSSQLSTIYNLMPSQTTHYIRMYLFTYSDSGYTTLIGEESAIWWTGLIPDSVVPTASMTYNEGGDTPSSWGVYVKGKSKLNITLIGSGAYGSTITAHSISGNGYTYNSNTALTNYLSTTGNITFTGIVTDSRGRQGSTSFVVNVLDYYNPSISTAQVQRCDENGNIDRNGDYCYISYGASISSCNGNNKANAHYKIGYRVHNTGDYQYITLANNLDSYSASGMLYTDGIFAADRGSGTKLELSSLNTYNIQFYVDDTFNPNGQTNTQQLDTGFDLMNFNPSGKAMAIGKVSEAGANEELFEVGINTEMYGDLSVSGEIAGGNVAKGKEYQNVGLNYIGENMPSGLYRIYANDNMPSGYTGATWFHLLQIRNDTQWCYQEIIHWWDPLTKYARKRVSGSWEVWRNISSDSYMKPIGTRQIFWGSHQFLKNQWQDLVNMYYIAEGFGNYKTGYTRWVRFVAWTNDNVSSGTGLTLGFFDDNNNYKNISFTFAGTWGSGTNDRGNYKLSYEYRPIGDINYGWTNLKTIIDGNSSGTEGYLMSLIMEVYDIPDGINPNNL